MCNHDLNKEDNTLKIFKGKTVMVYPKKTICTCMECGKSFGFIKVDGKYREIE